MNSPRHHEMDKLHAIDRQRDAIQQRLRDRLPRQRSQLTALVAATKWRLATLARNHQSDYTQALVDSITKKLRMEVGAFEYAAKEQSELLTRALLQLDDILSHGDATIKETRKALVVSIQTLLESADKMNATAASLKKFAERIITRLPSVPETVEDEPMEEQAQVETTDPSPMEQVDDDWEHVSAYKVRPLFASDDEDEETKEEEEQKEEAVMMDDAIMAEPEAPEETEEPQEDEAEDEEEQHAQDDGDEDAQKEEDDANEEGEEEDADAKDEEEDAEEEEELEQGEEPTNENVEDESTDDSLPVWRPYYQLQKRPDGVYLVANLHGVDPRDIQVHAMPQHGVLQISGAKYPTQKDMLLSRISGAPTYGRFEIVERFPTDLLNLENASQQLRADGTLEVRLPFYLVHHPRVFRRVSPFQPYGLSVW